MIGLVLSLIAIVLGSSSPLQAPSDFVGRWQLQADRPDGQAIEIQVASDAASSWIKVERHYADRATADVCVVIASAAMIGTCHATWRGSSLVLRWGGNGGQGAAPPIPDHEEVWSLAGDGVLHVDVTERLRRGTLSETHLSYRRASRPTARDGENLLGNPNADAAMADWLTAGDAAVESCDGNPCFVIRDRGSFQQSVWLPAEAAGRYLVMQGWGASERVNVDRAITGLPYLYGMALVADSSRILDYFQDRHAMAQADQPNQWVAMWGVYRVPAGAERLTFQLAQAERQGVPQNGSAARFDDLGCYLFSNESAALAHLAAWLAQGRP
jgi:hypothetical protein